MRGVVWVGNLSCYVELTAGSRSSLPASRALRDAASRQGASWLSAYERHPLHQLSSNLHPGKRQRFLDGLQGPRELCQVLRLHPVRGHELAPSTEWRPNTTASNEGYKV